MLSKEIKQRSIFPDTIIGLIIINEQGRIEVINKKSIELLGFDKKQLINTSFSNLVIESDKDKLISYFNSSSESSTIKIQIKSISNKPIPIELELATSSSDLKKQHIGIIKEKKIVKGIEKEVEDLKEAKEKVSKKLEKEIELNELKSRFVTVSSHEFRTPLAGILSSIQLIKRYVDYEKNRWEEFNNKNKIETHFDKIEESVLNLNHILNDFLSLAKIEENKVICNYDWFNLSSFLDELCKELAPLCKSNQKIICRHYGDKKEIFLDKHILRNTINNLVSNAIKYSSDSQCIEITSRTENSFLNIEVKDEGIGIPISEQKNIFERFFRAGNVLDFEGTGLGLNIVKKYTELMNGSITFESTENQGTTFFIKYDLTKNKPHEKNINN